MLRAAARPGMTLLLLALLLRRAAQAEPIADFYRGKTVNVLIGVGVGGEYDIQARLVARHIGKHIPGNPTVVPQNMTGAGGLRMVNYLYNVAPKDGLSIGMIANASAGDAGGRHRQRAVRCRPGCNGSAPSRRWSKPWRCGARPA